MATVCILYYISSASDVYISGFLRSWLYCPLAIEPLKQLHIVQYDLCLAQH